MSSIQAGELPDGALLEQYAHTGAYTDCYWIDIPRPVTLAAYVSAFYTTPLFKVERRLLSLIAGKHSTDADVHELALGQRQNFSAWSVEGRTGDQLLLRDFLGRTRSWLMVRVTDTATSSSTRLYFGSAVVPRSSSPPGKASFGVAFHALYHFHCLYAKALLRAAHGRLGRPSASAPPRPRHDTRG